jgi:hypothetical protein
MSYTSNANLDVMRCIDQKKAGSAELMRPTLQGTVKKERCKHQHRHGFNQVDKAAGMHSREIR